MVRCLQIQVNYPIGFHSCSSLSFGSSKKKSLLGIARCHVLVHVHVPDQTGSTYDYEHGSVATSKRRRRRPRPPAPLPRPEEGAYESGAATPKARPPMHRLRVHVSRDVAVRWSVALGPHARHRGNSVRAGVVGRRRGRERQAAAPPRRAAAAPDARCAQAAAGTARQRGVEPLLWPLPMARRQPGNPPCRSLFYLCRGDPPPGAEGGATYLTRKSQRTQQRAAPRSAGRVRITVVNWYHVNADIGAEKPICLT